MALHELPRLERLKLTSRIKRGTLGKPQMHSFISPIYRLHSGMAVMRRARFVFQAIPSNLPLPLLFTDPAIFSSPCSLCGMITSIHLPQKAGNRVVRAAVVPHTLHSVYHHRDNRAHKIKCRCLVYTSPLRLLYPTSVLKPHVVKPDSRVYY
jgi:hypothetical protein